MQANLPNLLQDKRSAYQAPEPQLSDLIHVDSPLLSFGQFHSSKLLGSHITFTNQSNRPVRFLAKIESTSMLNPADSVAILNQFYEEDLPFSLTKFNKKGAKKLQNHTEYFSIEEPYTRSLVNEIMLELEPEEKLTLIVVLRTPLIAHANIFALLTAYRQHDTPKQVSDASDCIRVALCGRLQNPEVRCLKAEWDGATQT